MDICGQYEMVGYLFETYKPNKNLINKRGWIEKFGSTCTWVIITKIFYIFKKDKVSISKNTNQIFQFQI